MWCWRKMEKISWTCVCEKWSTITKSPSGKEYPTYNKRKEGYVNWSHLTWEPSSKTCYGRKDMTFIWQEDKEEVQLYIQEGYEHLTIRKTDSDLFLTYHSLLLHNQATSCLCSPVSLFLMTVSFPPAFPRDKNKLKTHFELCSWSVTVLRDSQLFLIPATEY
jgi:hypothetical protein